jgi:SAM-dependent methyltransferase
MRLMIPDCCQTGPVPDFDDLVAQAMAAPFSGWDFSWLAGHASTRPPAWDYRRRAADLAGTAQVMLDMGTGGGEVLSQLPARAPRTVATEAWPPNVAVAGQRLRRLGIEVVQDEGAPDNMSQAGDGGRGRLPFRDGAFQLITNRHEAFRAAEVSRVLAPGGTFITQQVDYRSYHGLYRALMLAPPDQPESWLPLAERQLAQAGLSVTETACGEERHQFDDVAGIAYYLRVVGWSIPEYQLDTHLGRLRALHADAAAWPVVSIQRQFLLLATKPGRRPEVTGPGGPAPPPRR